jgi:hypothetical protein
LGILQLRQLGKYGLSQVIKEWKENVGFGVVVVVAAWSLVFWMSVVNTIYKDHQSLVAKRKAAERTIGTATRDRDNWKQQFEELRQHPPRPPAVNRGDGMQPSKVGPVTMTFSQYHIAPHLTCTTDCQGGSATISLADLRLFAFCCRTDYRLVADNPRHYNGRYGDGEHSSEAASRNAVRSRVPGGWKRALSLVGTGRTAG